MTARPPVQANGAHVRKQRQNAKKPIVSTRDQPQLAQHALKGK